MNPALPLLLVASLAGLLFRRREWGIAWTVCGLAATALLYPALSIPDGIPSPAATLAEQVPWRGHPGLETAGIGNPNLRDVTHQITPWLLFLRHELRAGRLPFWDPHQFSGSPFWSNGQGAPLFPLHLIFAALPLEFGFVLLPWLRLLIGGLGAYGLARALGVSRPAALLAAVAYPLSGMVSGFVLYPMGNTHALVPWVLLAVERLASGAGTWRGLAIAGGIQLLGGHPETPVLTGVLATVYLVVRVGIAPIRIYGAFIGGWIGALAIAAIQIVPLYRTLVETGKWTQHVVGEAPPLAIVARLWLRFVWPGVFGSPADGTWTGPFNDIATAVYVGLVPLALAVGALVLLARRRSWDDRRWWGIGALTFVALVGAYHLPGARQILLSIPVLDRAIHHYLKFGVELGLALLAAYGLDRVLTASWLKQRPVVRWAPAAVVLATAVDLIAAHARVNPGLSLASLYPRTGAIDFLAGHPHADRVAGLGTALFPDAAMVYGLYDVRGDSPVKLERYERVYDEIGTSDPVYFLPMDDWTDPWLDRLAVRWVIGGPAEEAPASTGTDWRLAYSGVDARVWERPGRFSYLRGVDDVTVLLREPGLWELDVRSLAGTTLEIAETFDRGWRATVDGLAVPVEAIDDVFLGVRVPAGTSRVELRYRPDGFALGATLSLAGLLALAVPMRRRKSA